jgi:ketosteroid isomerase-like protein
MADALETVERFYAALEADDVDGMLALCADDVEIRYPADGALPYGGTWTGRDGAGQFLEAHDAAEEILEFQLGRMVADGELVVVLGRFTGRVKSSGSEWSTAFVHALTVTDGRIRRWEAFFDTAAALAAR